ncbi:helix-turn-helix domain-containing protein [Fulvimarina sp. MAC3]|uniref:helix-turn-helix domain-containing protein n=1 Tax=Fulvimarina sp. MAC3 TaxID=3148887 RepID=UPI0031FBAE36
MHNGLYVHLSSLERQQLGVRHAAGHSNAEIAKALGRSAAARRPAATMAIKTLDEKVIGPRTYARLRDTSACREALTGSGFAGSGEGAKCRSLRERERSRAGEACVRNLE